MVVRRLPRRVWMKPAPELAFAFLPRTYGCRLPFSRTRVQHPLRSSTIELPSAVIESGAYMVNSMHSNPLVRAVATCQAFRASITCLSRATPSPRTPKFALGRGSPRETIRAQPAYSHRSSTNRVNRVDSRSVSPLDDESSLTPSPRTP